MEKKIKIFYSEYSAPAVKLASEPVAVNLTELEKFYERLGERQKKDYDKFASFWANEGFEALYHPVARVVVMPIGTAEESFGAELSRVNNSVSEAVMMVWTIGAALERRCQVVMSERGSLMDGILLDVVGSIALCDMHAALCRWVRDVCAVPRGKYVNGEFYPGLGSMRQDLMEKVVSLGNTEETIGVSADAMSLLRPRKSQCSFIALGDAEHEAVFKSEPCVPCSGKKCLYYQLGGCHMQALV